MILRDDVNERAQARIGHTLNGKWRLDGVLGIGGMATVYAATHRNRSRAAIKMLHPEVSVSQDVTTRFLREGYVGNAVVHPGTVKVLDDDVTDDGAPFLVMELLEGESLGARLDREGPLPPLEVAQIAHQLLDVLSAAHAAHIVHRDLKPDNVFLTTDGRVKVLDFGIARLRAAAHEISSSTQAGSLLGTPAFMAPEQALGRWKEVDERTDIWAVGATLFTLLTGRFVHEAEAVQEQLVLAATSKAPGVRSFAPRTPPWLADVVDRALSFGRDLRYVDARTMQATLRRSAVGVELLPYPMSVPGSAPFSGNAATPTGLHPTSSSDRRPLSSPTFTEGATLAATNASTQPGPGASALASVQAVARSAQQPPPSRRSSRASLALGALGFGAVVAISAGLWFTRLGASERQAALPTAAVAPVPTGLAPPQVATAKSPPSASTIVPTAPPKPPAAPPRPAKVSPNKPVALAKKQTPPPAPPVLTLPTFSSPPKSNGNTPTERRENLFDQRH
jgi:eukaryotic-like serine/threonine-protein kinase